ncbi:hypothetical protein VDG1235_2756 [Verrucomicrobiia bacterium DG1235]|nr:hypothetical protein VDG1235_2756 [Verrucomicrobiae bacterium DG1235]
MGNKKNGKLVVAAVLGSVLLASGIAFTVQQMINANKGKPPRSQPAQLEEAVKEAGQPEG